jgi:hypothetical protein
MRLEVIPSFCVLVLLSTGCVRSEPVSSTPRPPRGRLSGNVDARPYTAHVAYARLESGGRIDIKAFDRPVTREIGCLGGEQGLVDMQQTVLIQMEWPVPEQGVASSTLPSQNANHAGVFLMVRRGLGGSGQRAAANVRILEAANDGGVLFVDAATSNHMGGVHGSVRGLIPFTICN